MILKQNLSVKALKCDILGVCEGGGGGLGGRGGGCYSILDVQSIYLYCFLLLHGIFCTLRYMEKEGAGMHENKDRMQKNSINTGEG